MNKKKHLGCFEKQKNNEIQIINEACFFQWTFFI